MLAVRNYLVNSAEFLKPVRPEVGIFRGKVGIDFFQVGIKILGFDILTKNVSFPKILQIFLLKFQQHGDFFLKPWGFLNKSGDYFAKCGDF